MSSRRRPYVESPVIMSTVRLVAPFVLTFGLFVTLHGATSPGGGFQGGVIVASVIVMLSFAYGIDPTWEWLDKRVLVGLASGGVAVFGGVALGAVFFDGGDFLQLATYPVDHSSKYGIELVEVAIAMIVTGVVVLLFFSLGRGAMPPTGASPTATTEGPDATAVAVGARSEPDGTGEGDPAGARDEFDGSGHTTVENAGKGEDASEVDDAVDGTDASTEDVGSESGGDSA